MISRKLVALASVLISAGLLVRGPVMGSGLPNFHVVTNTPSQQRPPQFPLGKEGILIVQAYTNPKLVFLDRTTKEIVWQRPMLPFIKCVTVLPGGDLLICLGHHIARLDKHSGAISLSPAEFENPADVKPLDNGRMLVSVGDQGTVSEVDWSGHVEWSITGLYYPMDALRLENGDTLVADGTACVKEFDRRGKLVAVTGLSSWAASVRRVNGDQTLVGEGDGVELLDRAGHTIWRRLSGRINGVEQLPDGQYLVSAEDRVVILDASGNSTWEAKWVDTPFRTAYIR